METIRWDPKNDFVPPDEPCRVMVEDDIWWPYQNPLSRGWASRIDRVMANIALNPSCVFFVCTKSIDTLRAYFTGQGKCLPSVIGGEMGSMTDGERHFDYGQGWPLPNLYLGVHVTNQIEAWRDLLLLREAPCAGRYVVVSPKEYIVLSSEISRTEGSTTKSYYAVDYLEGENKLDWVNVQGGERNHVSSLQLQCMATKTPFACDQAINGETFNAQLGDKVK